MLSTVNPYIKKSVSKVEDFYGYFDQKKILKEELETSNRYIIFKGDPNTGKTSFIYLTGEFCKDLNFIPCEINASDCSNSWNFFDSMFLKIFDSLEKYLEKKTKSINRLRKSYIDTKSTGIQTQDNKLISGLRFPYNYYHDSSSSDNFPQANLIIEDIKYILDSIGQTKKIVILIDDFQEVFNIDEFSDLNDITQQSYNNGFNICKTFLKIWDRIELNKLQICIASYPEIFNQENQAQKLVARCFLEIKVDKFNSKEEMDELFKKPLKNIPNHFWCKIFFDNDENFINKIYKSHRDRWNEYMEGFKDDIKNDTKDDHNFQAIWALITYGEEADSIIKSNINELINKLARDISYEVHENSRQRPFYAKLILQYLFEKSSEIDTSININMEKSNKRSPVWQSFYGKKDDVFLNSIVNIQDQKLLQEVYKNVITELQSNEKITKFSEYHIQTKYHMDLFMAFPSFDLSEIVKVVEMGKIYDSILEKKIELITAPIQGLNNTIEEFEIKPISNQEYYKKYCNELSNINIDNLKSSLNKLVNDKIIRNYPHDHYKYQLSLNTLEESFMFLNISSFKIRRPYSNINNLNIKNFIIYNYLLTTNLNTIPVNSSVDNTNQLIKKYKNIINNRKLILLNDSDHQNDLLRRIFSRNFDEMIFYTYGDKYTFISLINNKEDLSVDKIITPEILFKKLKQKKYINETLKKIDSIKFNIQDKLDLANALIKKYNQKSKLYFIAKNYYNNIDWSTWWKLQNYKKAFLKLICDLNNLKFGKPNDELRLQLFNNSIFMWCLINKNNLNNTEKKEYDDFYKKIIHFIDSNEEEWKGSQLTYYNFIILKNSKNLKILKKEFNQVLKNDDEWLNSSIKTYSTFLYFNSKGELKETFHNKALQELTVRQIIKKSINNL